MEMDTKIQLTDGRTDKYFKTKSANTGGHLMK